MPQYLFSVLFLLHFLLLLVVICTCGLAYADSTAQPNVVELFAAGQTKDPSRPSDITPNKVPQSFQSPFLVGADGVMVAFAEAKHAGSDNGEGNSDIAARYIETQGKNWAEKTIQDNGRNWNTQLAMQKDTTEGRISKLTNPVAVVKGNNIYLVAVSSNEGKTKGASSTTPTWDIELSVGEITSASGTQQSKTIHWKPPKSLNNTLTQQLHDKTSEVLPYASSAFLGEDGRIVLVVRSKKDNAHVSAIIHSRYTGDETELKWSYAEIVQYCDFPSFFEWGQKLIMVTHCVDGSYKVKESTDMGVTWTDAVGQIGRVLDNLKGNGDFATTVTIENKTVVLFTQSTVLEVTSKMRKEIHLWITDGNRVYYMGPIVASDIHVTLHSLLYTNSELFSLHQKWDGGAKGIFLTRLKDKLEKIKSVLKAWVETDKYLTASCNETVPKAASSGSSCPPPMPTDGLVGFLSNTMTENIWQDEYLYANATVRRGIKVANGVKFATADAGAQWPIGKQGLDQRYNFTRHGLTVVATVTIHEVPQGNAPLLTFEGGWGKGRIGLWYDKDKKWKVISKEGVTSANVWETNKAYQVKLIVKNKNISVYVNGKPVGSPLRISGSEKETFDVEHLFIGAYEENNVNPTLSHVTVTNVFLYNWLFNDTGINTFGKKATFGDSSVHIPMGTVLLSMLSLWGLVAFC